MAMGLVPLMLPNHGVRGFRAVPEANLFPPHRNAGSGSGQIIGGPPPTEGFEQQPTDNWRGVFSISSYSPYFNVDTNVVINRLLSSFYPIGGDFFSKIDANPDLCANGSKERTAALLKASVGYFSMAVWSRSVYGYPVLVPLAFYLLLLYLGSNTSLIRFWCL